MEHLVMYGNEKVKGRKVNQGEGGEGEEGEEG
jgi:hypothetical protein